MVPALDAETLVAWQNETRQPMNTLGAVSLFMATVSHFAARQAFPRPVCIRFVLPNAAKGIMIWERQA